MRRHNLLYISFKHLCCLVLMQGLLLFVLTGNAVATPNDSLKAYRKMLLPDSKAKADTMLQTALSYRKLLDVEPFLKETERLIKKYGYKELEVKLLDTYGVYKRDRSAYPEAIEFHKMALQLAQKQNNITAQINSLNNLGVVFRRLGESELALKYHLEALKLSEQTGDNYSESIALNSIGNIHTVLGHYREAIKYFHRCLPIARLAKNDLGIAMNLNNIGEAYENLNLLDSAKYYYELSLQYNRQINIKKGTAIGYNSIGNILKKQGKVAEAIVLFKKALEINISLKDKIYVANNYINLGEAYLSNKQYPEADKALKSGLDIALLIHSKIETKDSYYGLMVLNEILQNYKLALNFSKQYKKYADSIVNEKNSHNVAQMEAIYDKDKEQQKIIYLEKSQRDNHLLIIASFVLLAFVVITGSLSIIRHRLLLRNRQLQQEMSVRYQIAADLHDDLGSTLSSISILSSVLLQHIENEKPPREVVDKIFENAQNALKSIDDIIWSVNPKNNKFSNLFSRISEYAVPLFESKHIDFKIVIPDSVNSLPFTLEVGRNSYLIIKESINNLVKHSKCTKAHVIVFDRHPYIEIEISDNGVGFIESQNSSHNGVFNMHERARQIDAQFSIKSTVGSGTTIRLTVKSY